jgi:ribose/xylose/arabinose/galactoside ABC-type transport system permease subunit
MTYVGISPFWAKAIQGLIILAALVADAAMARLERHGSLVGRGPAVAR